MHTLPDNTIFCTLGTPGLVTNGGTFGAPALYQQLNDADYITFYAIGSGSAVSPFGTLNVFQGTTSTGGSAKVVTGASITLGTTTGTAWAVTIKANQLDTANNYQFVNAVGTTPTSGTAFISVFSIKTSTRNRPGTHGLTGSVFVVS